MKVVLLQDVPSLGRAGEVKEVADGYGRNFLIPRKLASPGTRGSLAVAEVQHRAEVLRHQRSDANLEELARQLEGLSINIQVKVGAGGRLYGSVTSTDIVEGVTRLLGQDLDRRKIELEEPIRQLGSYEVPVRLTGGLMPRLKVIVEEEKG